MQNRRDFLKQASLMLAGGLVVPQLLSSCAGKTKPAADAAAATAQAASKYIGLQLYSLRDMVKDDGIQKVLEAVAKIGYKNLEAASYDDGKFYGLAPADFKKMVNDLGMKITSSHLSKAMSKDKKEQAEVMAWWDKAIEAHNQLGVKYMVQPMMDYDEKTTTLDDVKQWCDYFSSVGLKTAAASIQFGYHNHDYEFKKIKDQVIYDYMLQNVSKNHVFFELDVYWCMFGGGNVVDYMKKYADQIKVRHIKDEKEIGASGKMDFKPIFDQAYANNIKDWYVEIEEYSNNDPLASCQQSYDYLNKADYVK
jgi:sugar phosphate isomerase/epimerase